MKCAGCGAELAPDDEFCLECGARRPDVPPPLVEAPRPEAQPAPVPLTAADEPGRPPPSNTPRRKWVAISCIGLLAVALLLAGLLGIWLVGVLFQSQGLPSGEPTSVPRPTPTWLPAPPTPSWVPAAPTPSGEPGLAPTATAPSIAPVVVMPYCSAFERSPVHIRESQPVTIYWGWVAATSDYVQDFLDTATIEVLLDGQQVRPDTQSEIQYELLNERYVVGWSADVGTLTPGSHRLEYHVSWSRQISDGWYTFGPGGEYEEEHEYCELIVE